MGQWADEPWPQASAEVPQRDPMPQQWDQAATTNTSTTRETHRASARPEGRAAASDGTRRARRPATGAVIAIATAVSALPVFRILAHSAFGPVLSASGVISSVLVLLGLPLGGLGLYGVATGAAQDPDAPGPRAWLRPPIAYLTVALVLFVAAGLATR